MKKPARPHMPAAVSRITSGRHHAANPRIMRRIRRAHKRTRRSVPWIQSLLLTLLLPLAAVVTRVRFVGRENVPDGGYMVVSNHPSLLDSFFLAAALRRRVRFMGKSDLWAGRWGGFLSRLGAFPVLRGVWDEEAFETAVAIITSGKVLAIFPEGGLLTERGVARSGPGHIAHQAGATVVPIYLEGLAHPMRWWPWPKVVVKVGPPVRVERIADPSREQSQQTAQRLLNECYKLVDPGKDPRVMGPLPHQEGQGNLIKNPSFEPDASGWTKGAKS